MEKGKLLHHVIKLVFSVILLIYGSMSYAVGWFDIISHLEKQNVKDKEQYQKIVQENKEKVEKYAEQNKELVKNAECAFKEHTNKIQAEEGSITDQIIKNTQNLNQERRRQPVQGIVIFVSFNMPKELLWSYFKQAETYGARIVLRGLIDGSFKQTIKAMNLGNDRYLKLDINPILFKQYKIKYVPAIVIAGDKVEGIDTVDKFVGSVTLKYALEESASKGDQQQFSKEKLKERV